MHHLLRFTILLGSFLTSKSAHINSSIINQNATELNKVNRTDDEKYACETEKKIQALQKEKDDLYKQINEAIDEVVPELARANDTEAITGVQHLKTLKQQLKEIHEADSAEEATDNSTEVNNTTDFRRKISINIERKREKKGWLSKLKQDDFYKKLIKARDKKYTSAPNVQNREKIASQIQQWLVKKREEKKKIREYKARMKVDYEKCPNFGKGKYKKGKNKGKKKKRNVFPCCRKCCKKSYLGCL